MSTTLHRENDGHDEHSAALDTLVAVLRSYGHHAIDTDAATAEQSAGEVERWVKHVTMGTALKGGGRAGSRDWRALSRSFNDHRRGETESLNTALGQLRETVWNFVSSLHMAMVDDKREQQAASDQLMALRAATEGASTAELRRVAESTLHVFDSVLTMRQRRQKEQQEILGAQLRALSQQLEEARRASTLDPLTELPNRKEFDDFATRVLQLHSFVPSPSCLLMIDVDGFKQLNDRYGHQLGDIALQEVAHALARTFLRRCDFVCRYGGDEFAAIMRDTSPEAALRQADRLCAAVRDLQLPGRVSDMRLSLSVGVAELREGEEVEDWMRRADAALYRAKEAGRNRAALADI